MSAEATGHRQAVVTSARTLSAGSVHGVPSPLRRVATIGGDLIMLGGLVFCIPFAILGIGIPIAMFVQLLLWIGRLF